MSPCSALIQTSARTPISAPTIPRKVPVPGLSDRLGEGWPIATGVIEGACRHLVKDRLDITDARWDLEGAEAVLNLRALRSNGDWESYSSFHLSEERQRGHNSRYLDNVIPTAA